MKSFSIAFTAFLLFFSLSSFAQMIAKTTSNGTQVLIRFESINESQFQVGNEFYAMSSEGKKVAIVKITKVKGTQAIGAVTKGKVEAGLQLTPRSTQNAGSSDGKKFHKKSGLPVAVFIGYGSSAMSLTAQYSTNGTVVSSNTLNLTGTSFNMKGMFEIPLGSRFFARGTGGLETFSVKGSGRDANSGAAICDSGTSADCKAIFNYFALEGSGHFTFMQSQSLRGHIGLGYSYLLTLSKEVNIPNLNTSSSTNQMMLAKLGFDIVTKSAFFPILAEYGYIPGSNVKASGFYIRAGYGFYF